MLILHRVFGFGLFFFFSSFGLGHHSCSSRTGLSRVFKTKLYIYSAAFSFFSSPLKNTNPSAMSSFGPLFSFRGN